MYFQGLSMYWKASTISLSGAFTVRLLEVR
ncbi:hypothetical protein LINPERHAP2_LOCUS10324 [Linum perenne]